MLHFIMKYQSIDKVAAQADIYFERRYAPEEDVESRNTEWRTKEIISGSRRSFHLRSPESLPVDLPCREEAQSSIAISESDLIKIIEGPGVREKGEAARKAYPFDEIMLELNRGYFSIYAEPVHSDKNQNMQERIIVESWLVSDSPFAKMMNNFINWFVYDDMVEQERPDIRYEMSGNSLASNVTGIKDYQPTRRKLFVPLRKTDSHSLGAAEINTYQADLSNVEMTDEDGHVTHVVDFTADTDEDGHDLREPEAPKRDSTSPGAALIDIRETDEDGHPVGELCGSGYWPSETNEDGGDLGYGAGDIVETDEDGAPL